MGGRIIAEFTTPEGDRGKLRDWTEHDLAGFLEMLRDPDVMEFLLKQDTDEARRQIFDKIRNKNAANGWGIWAVEIAGEFAGWTGLNTPDFESAFTPCVEIGWRFQKRFWGKSIAFKAAKCAENFAFKKLKLEELVSFTTTTNQRSQRLMQRLGFLRDHEHDFDFPGLATDHPLLKHVLYRKQNPY